MRSELAAVRHALVGKIVSDSAAAAADTGTSDYEFYPVMALIIRCQLFEGIQGLSGETQQHWRKINTLIARSTKRISEHVQDKLPARSNGMSRLSSLFIVCATLSAGTGSAHAGTCANQITQLRQVAQLDHQPTPETVRQVQTYGQLMFAAALAEAEALNVEGNEAECLLAASRAKQMRELG